MSTEMFTYNAVIFFKECNLFLLFKKRKEIFTGPLVLSKLTVYFRPGDAEAIYLDVWNSCEVSTLHCQELWASKATVLSLPQLFTNAHPSGDESIFVFVVHSVVAVILLLVSVLFVSQIMYLPDLLAWPRYIHIPDLRWDRALDETCWRCLGRTDKSFQLKWILKKKIWDGGKGGTEGRTTAVFFYVH